LMFCGGASTCRWGGYEQTRSYPYPNSLCKISILTLPVIPHTQWVI
jgi:hypothetical protein